MSSLTRREVTDASASAPPCAAPRPQWPASRTGRRGAARTPPGTPGTAGSLAQSAPRRMTSQGTAHGRFSRAIKTRNLWAAETAMREMGSVSLLEALDYLALLAELRPERAGRAAVRWHGRLETEAPLLMLAESQFAPLLAALASPLFGGAGGRGDPAAAAAPPRRLQPEKLGRRAARWHGRLEVEAPLLTLAESRLALAALASRRAGGLLTCDDAA